MKTSSQTNNKAREWALRGLLALSLFASFGAVSLAVAGDRPFENRTSVSESPKTIYNWVQKQLHCPRFIQDGGEKAEVTLHISETGKVSVSEIKTTDVRLAEYVKKQLEGQTIDVANTDLNRDFHFVIRFQLI